MLSADEEAKLRERLDQLILEHRDLDDVIDVGAEAYTGCLQIRRLKSASLLPRHRKTYSKYPDTGLGA